MKIFTKTVGNLHAPAWNGPDETPDIEYIELDQWTAQKSRFVVRGDRGNEYAVALRRHVQLLDGDLLEYLPEQRRAIAVRIRLNDVLVVDLSALAAEAPEQILRTAVELGHALGNQHWPAVVRGNRVYVPLTVDRKVMESVMRTHRLEGIAYGFQPGEAVIPYLAPHEIRRLFGGTGPESDAHPYEHSHPHEHAHIHEHEHEHQHPPVDIPVR